MKLLDNVVEFLSKYATVKNEKVVVQKQDENVGRLLAPVFREIPPNSKAGKFLTEGFRSWAFIAISAVADEVSTTDIGLYKKQTDGWVSLENHPALKLIEKPNQFQTKEEFFWLASVYWLAEGEAPIYLNSPKNPTEMVLLNPERINVIFDSKSIIGKYTYRQSNGTLTDIPAENVFMLKMPSVTTPFRGAGVMRYIAQTLDIDNFIEEYLKLFFFNDTTPGAVLETDQELNQTIIERLRVQFANRHQGIKNSHKLSVLEKGMKYHKISSNINELQLKELNDMIRDKVLAGFKVPKSVLGIVEDVNRANAEASSYTFSKRAVLPKLKMIEGQLNQFLLPKFNGGDQLWFEFENPVFEDKMIDAQVYALGIQNGWLTANEVREQIGLDPMDDDEEMEEPEMPDTDLDDDIDETDAEGAEDVGKYAKPKAKRVREKKRPDALVDIMKDVLESENPQPKKFYSEDELAKFHTDKIMFVDHLERDYSADLKKNFRRQKRTLLKQIEGKNVKANAVNLQLDVEEEVLQMVKITNPYLYDAITTESKLAYGLLGLQNTLTPADDVVKTFVKNRTVKLGKASTATTQEAVDKIVKDWTEEGTGSWTDLREELTLYFDGQGEEGALARADMIARTELSNATGFAQNEVYRQTGAVGKQWLTASDEMVCEYCSDMNDKYGDGMIVGIDENFFNKGDELTTDKGTLTFSFDSVDTPPLHPNCRCDIIPVYAESKSNKDEVRKRWADRKAKQTAEREQADKLEQMERELREKELRLIEKEQQIAQTEITTKKNLSEIKKTKAKAEKELAEIEKFKDKINGTVE